jgi:hypothetical protein
VAQAEHPIDPEQLLAAAELLAPAKPQTSANDQVA